MKQTSTKEMRTLRSAKNSGITPNTTTFPALAEHKNLRYFSFIALYFSQGIPEGITCFAIPAWMAMNGKSADGLEAEQSLV